MARIDFAGLEQTTQVAAQLLDVSAFGSESIKRDAAG